MNDMFGIELSAERTSPLTGAQGKKNQARLSYHLLDFVARPKLLADKKITPMGPNGVRGRSCFVFAKILSLRDKRACGQAR